MNTKLNIVILIATLLEGLGTSQAPVQELGYMYMYVHAFQHGHYIGSLTNKL